MTDEEIKQAEHRGYSRGYQAGKRRREQDHRTERLYREKCAFMDRAFLSALSACVTVSGWKHGDKPINNIKERVSLAWDFASEAVKQRRYP